jgi:hypothetical protein
VPCKIIASTIAKMVDLYTKHNTWVGMNMIIYSVFCVGMNIFSYCWFPFVFMKNKKKFNFHLCPNSCHFKHINFWSALYYSSNFAPSHFNWTKKKPWNNFTKCHSWIRKWTNDGLDSGWIRAQIWMIENEYQISKIRFKSLYLTWDQNSIARHGHRLVVPQSSYEHS